VLDSTVFGSTTISAHFRTTTKRQWILNCLFQSTVPRVQAGSNTERTIHLINSLSDLTEHYCSIDPLLQV
jgi:hypothetical protein